MKLTIETETNKFGVFEYIITTEDGIIIRSNRLLLPPTILTMLRINKEYARPSKNGHK